MANGLTRLVKRSKWAVIAAYTAYNRLQRRKVATASHAQSRGASVSEAVEYVEMTYDSILRSGRLSAADLDGARVLELGPGDNTGLALRLLAAGAADVVTLDKFEVRRDAQVERQTLAGVRAGLSAEEGRRADPARVRSITGVGIEEAVGLLEPESFDLIVSIAVLEHVYDPDASFTAMDRLLRPGGLLLHQVDLRDHGIFTAGGMHPLTFLTVSQRVWKAMTYDWGGPNRRLIDYYRERVGTLGYEARLLVNQVLGAEANVPVRDALAEGVEVSPHQRALIREIRSRLQPDFRALPDEDLVPAGVFLVARKPPISRPS